MVLMCVARGQSVITETIFENRYMHVPELERMGADIHVDGRTAVVRGVHEADGRDGDGDRPARLGVRWCWPGSSPRARPRCCASTTSIAATSRLERKLRALGADVSAQGERMSGERQGRRRADSRSR